MTRNVGPEDRVVRIVIAVALCVLIYFNVVNGTGAIIAGVAAAILLLTGLFAWCPFYKMIGMDTAIQEQPYSTTDDRAGL